MTEDSSSSSQPSLDTLLQWHDLQETFSPQQLSNLAHLAAFFDKFYFQDANANRYCCRFCEESYPQLIKTACGCLICSRCLYCELPSIPLSKCPYCSCFQQYTVQTPQRVLRFNFSPLKPSTEDTHLTTSAQIKVLEIYPVTLAQDENCQLQAQQVICRFHKELGGSCDQLINCDFQRYAEHLSECRKQHSAAEMQSAQNQANQQVQQSQQYYSSKRVDLLRHCQGLVSPAARQLFAGPQPQLQPARQLPPHRAPVIFQPICRRLLVERGDILRNQKNYNFQLLCFANPLENCDISACGDIICGLRVLYPDDTFEEMEFWVQKDQLIKCGILRFFARVSSRLIGRYVIDLRYACYINADEPYWVYTTKQTVRYAIFDVNSDIRPIKDMLADSSILSISAYRLRLEVATSLIAEACQWFKASKSDEFQPRILQYDEFESLLTFGVFTCYLEDAMAFVTALHGICQNKVNQRVVVACSVLDVLVDLMDRFWDVYCLQKAGIDLIMLIVQSQEDMNVMSLKVPGLFGRLRRIKHQFVNTDSIDQLLNLLFRVSAIAVPEEVPVKAERYPDADQPRQE